MTEAFGAGDIIVQFLVTGLKTDLDMVQAGFLECLDPILIHADAGCDQVGVITQAPGFGDEFFQISPYQGFTAGETQLGGTHLARLLHHPEPVFGGELVLVFRDLNRV